jgi:hypothetical protein
MNMVRFRLVQTLLKSNSLTSSFIVLCCELLFGCLSSYFHVCVLQIYYGLLLL